MSDTIQNNRPTQAVILAGGLGTRLRPITDHIPKPMIEFHGKPFLEYLLTMLVDQGFKKIVLLLGYLPEKVTEYFGNGEKWGVEIQYSITDVADDTGLRLTKAKHLFDPIFVLLYCDNYWPMSFEKMWDTFTAVKVDALVTVYLNRDGYTKSNIRIDDKGFIEVYDKTREEDNLQGVDIGFFILRKEVINMIPEGNHNFEKTVLPQLIATHNIITYPTEHRYYSIGSHERLKLTDKFLKRKPTIILDRDGVINKKAAKANYITTWSQWEWIPGSKEAISLLSKSGFQIIIVTNQAGIARGFMTSADLVDIHEKMQQELKGCGGTIDKIYHCPHGWDDNCDCRKPKPGMLFQAQRDFHLDLSKLYFVGDDERDSIAGEAAGMHTFLVNDTYPLLNFVKEQLLIANWPATVL
uniref:HAD-IIIA family hydrolase n=1 Tax=Algoriphagus sp. TaxID=1872435 RepID=UPI0040474B01